MERKFTLPINAILRAENFDGSILKHYEYSSGKNEITVSHIRDNGKHYVTVSVYIREADKTKKWTIRSINETALNSLQSQIDTFLNKFEVDEFINSWQKLINEEYQDIEEKKIIKIENDIVFLKNGDSFDYPNSYKGKTIEELNSEREKMTLEIIEGYKKYLLLEE